MIHGINQWRTEERSAMWEDARIGGWAGSATPFGGGCVFIGGTRVQPAASPLPEVGDADFTQDRPAPCIPSPIGDETQATNDIHDDMTRPPE
jgi:hypothetical protein